MSTPPGQIVGQAIVDRHLQEFLIPKMGVPLSPVDVENLEKACRALILRHRDELKVIKFKDVEVKIQGSGDVIVTYDW